jgi:hypothetical protein
MSKEQEAQEKAIDLGSELNDTYSSADAGYRYPSYFDAVIDVNRFFLGLLFFRQFTVFYHHRKDGVSTIYGIF